MDNAVIIKGNKYGIVVVLDNELSFPELKIKIRKKFKESYKFFEKAEMAISFEGRELDNDEQREVLDIIGEETELHVICIVDNDKKREEIFKKSLDEKLMELSNTTGQFYKGNLRSGQVLESETSIIVIGEIGRASCRERV